MDGKRLYTGKPIIFELEKRGIVHLALNAISALRWLALFSHFSRRSRATALRLAESEASQAKRGCFQPIPLPGSTKSETRRSITLARFHTSNNQRRIMLIALLGCCRRRQSILNQGIGSLHSLVPRSPGLHSMPAKERWIQPPILPDLTKHTHHLQDTASSEIILLVQTMASP